MSYKCCLAYSSLGTEVKNYISFQMLCLIRQYHSAINACCTLAMNLKALQENLRKTLWDRIEEGDLTGLRLAQQTGFKQAHISNFLNRKRGLSFEGMDKLERPAPLRARPHRAHRGQ